MFSFSYKFRPPYLSTIIASSILLFSQLSNNSFASTNADGTLGLGASSCMVTATGTVQCWGDNTYGQLGNGITSSSSLPVAVTGLANIKAVSVGSLGHACAVTNAGTVWCWGNNGSGELGNGTTTSSNVPVQVIGLNNITSISLGHQHSCALDSLGAVKCWGINGSGQLGSGSSAAYSVTPVPVMGATTTAIASNYFTSCALDNIGAVRCWGYNGFGQLGNGTTTNSYTPVFVTGLTGAIGISLGKDFACAITNTNEVKCWGSGGFGQLGNGSNADNKTPVLVSALTNVKAISLGNVHACALTNTSDVLCWGDNGLKQLGPTTTSIQSNLPVSMPISGVTGAVTSLAAGNTHSCVLTTGCNLKCWGGNISGQLGNGTTINSSTPVSPTTTVTPKCSTTTPSGGTTSTTECGNPAKYDATARLVTIPAVDLPVLDPLTGKPSTQMATYSCNLQQSAGVDDFKVDAASLKFMAMTSSHLVQNALFEASTNEFDAGGKLTMCVQVPNVVITPLGPTTLPPSNYRVIMRQLAIQPDTLHIESILPLP